MKVRLLVVALTALTMAASVQAAKPKKFKAGEDANTSIVVCSNKAEHLLVKGDKGWCFAEACSKRRMLVAKKACKSPKK